MSNGELQHDRLAELMVGNYAKRGVKSDRHRQDQAGASYLDKSGRLRDAAICTTEPLLGQLVGDDVRR
jgi:hypothetical protein